MAGTGRNHSRRSCRGWSLQRWKVGYVAFYVAAISQIFLYTVFLDWIDVPTEFAVNDLVMLVTFHSITLILVTAALKVENHR